MQNASYNYPTRMILVRARAPWLGELLRPGASSPLIVTDRGIATCLSWRRSLAFEGLRLTPAVYSDIHRSDKPQVTGGVDGTGHTTDSFILLGGGVGWTWARSSHMINHPGTSSTTRTEPEHASGGPDIRSTRRADDGGAGERGEPEQRDFGRAAHQADHFRSRGYSRLWSWRIRRRGPAYGGYGGDGVDALRTMWEAFLAKGYHPMADGIALRACGWSWRI